MLGSKDETVEVHRVFCARCGAEVGTRAVVCVSCGADLTRAGAVRLTSGEPLQHAADLGLPEDLVARFDDEGRLREAGTGQGHRTPSQVDDEAVAGPSPDVTSRRHTIAASVLVVVLVLAAMWLVNTVAQRLMDPLPPVGPAPAQVSGSPSSPSSPGATPS